MFWIKKSNALIYIYNKRTNTNHFCPIKFDMNFETSLTHY